MKRLAIFLSLIAWVCAWADESIPVYSDLDSGSSNFLTAVFAYVHSGNCSSSAEAFASFANEFPADAYTAVAKDIAAHLVDLEKENRSWQEPAEWTALSTDEQIKYHIHHLRDLAFVQNSWPNECNVLWCSNETANAYHPAMELRKIGMPAVPSLIALLEDTRPTRCVGLWRPWRRSGWTLLRYQDVAIQILAGIAGQEFYRRLTTSSYLSQEPPEYRKGVIKNVKDWYRQNEEAEHPNRT